MPTSKKLIYILNHYSKNSAQHFFHITNLLKEIANIGVTIVLVIEKCDDLPDAIHSNIRIIAQKKHNKLQRRIELFDILTGLTKEGFNKVFIRISTSSALIAILISFFKNLEVYYWHSGTVKEFNDSVPFGIKKIKNYFFSALPFNLVKRYTKWFVTGPESMKDYYIENYNIRPSKILILYNDIDLQRFNSINEEKKNQFKLSLGINVSKKTILFVHRLSPVRKSLYYLPYILERFYEKNYSEFETVIIGEGSELEKLRQLVSSANLNDNVKILGGKPNSIIQQYYNIADIFINPTYTEGFPRVLIEAMAAGLPIVTTDAGGIKDIIDEKQRQLMVDRNDRDAFAEKLKELASNNKLRQELSKENLDRVKRYSTQNVAQMYVNSIFKN